MPSMSSTDSSTRSFTAALVLRDVARVVRDPRCRDPNIRATMATVHGEALIDAAIAIVDDLARPPDDHYQQEIASVDGVRFTVPVKTFNAGLNPRYFGVERGATWLNMA